MTIKDGDLFVVQADPTLTSNPTAGEIGYLTGAKLADWVGQIVANSPSNVVIFMENAPPPYTGGGTIAGVGDLWFDTSISTLFIMLETEKDPITNTPDYVWVMVNPGDRELILQNNDFDKVLFPHPLSVLNPAKPWPHPRTGAKYYYKSHRNQWVDVFAPSVDSIRANRDSIEILDDKVEERVKIAGDTMTGNLIMGGSTYISTTGLQDVKQFTPAYNMELIGDSVANYSKIDIVRHRPVGTGFDFGLKIDLSEAPDNNNLIIQGSDTILSINGNSGNTGVQFHKRINGTSLELQNDGGILLKADDSNLNYIRTYFPAGPGRTTALFYDNVVNATKFQVDNAPLKFTCTDGTITSGDDKVDLIKLAVSNTDTTQLGSYCSIQRLVEPTLDSDAATKKYVDDKSASVVEQYNSNTPPGSRARGTLLMTDNNQLYIYTG